MSYIKEKFGEFTEKNLGIQEKKTRSLWGKEMRPLSNFMQDNGGTHLGYLKKIWAKDFMSSWTDPHV